MRKRMRIMADYGTEAMLTLNGIKQAQSIEEISEILDRWEELSHEINLELYKAIERETGRSYVADVIARHKQRPKPLSHLLNKTDDKTAG